MFSSYWLIAYFNFIKPKIKPCLKTCVLSSEQSKQEIHRRSARLRSTKYKAPASEKKVSSKGKGRRHIFKLKNVSTPEGTFFCQFCQV